MGKLGKLPLLLWASPWSLLGLSVGLLVLMTGGRSRVRGPVIEFHGGLISRLFERFPATPIAMTLGHVLLGRSAAALDIAYTHELVHVRQYERWGPAFVPVYLTWSLVLWLQGKDPYRDNPFERQAYGEDDRTA